MYIPILDGHLKMLRIYHMGTGHFFPRPQNQAPCRRWRSEPLINRWDNYGRFQHRGILT